MSGGGGGAMVVLGGGLERRCFHWGLSRLKPTSQSRLCKSRPRNIGLSLIGRERGAPCRVLKWGAGGGSASCW